MVFFFQPANITSQILNFGLPAPIDLQVVGRNAEANYQDRAEAGATDCAHSGRGRRSRAPGGGSAGNPAECGSGEGIANGIDAARCHQQHADLSQRQRHRGAELLDELDQRHQLQHRRADPSIPDRFAGCPAAHADLARRMSVNSTTPSSQAGAAGGECLHRRFAERRVAGLRKSRRRVDNTQLLSNLVSVQRSYMPVIVNHYNVWPVFDVYANVDRRDLGGVGAEVRKIMREEEAHLPRGTSFDLRGQIETMQSSFFRLGLGMIFAVVLVYLLMTVNFQSWVDPFIILTALPGAMAGILWMLFITGTTLSVPSLMGAIMCIGVATANSILMVTFANDERGRDAISAREAMLSAGYARIRPVLMTATAMILGMLPMSLAWARAASRMRRWAAR